KYDSDGALQSIAYGNGDVDTFNYGKMGELLSAENKCSKIEFEYDKMGRVVKEVQNDHTVGSEYADGYFEGGRVSINTSLGLNIDIKRSKDGLPKVVTADFQNIVHQSSFSFNMSGQALVRTISTVNGRQVSDSWSYDKLGLPVAHNVSMDNRESMRRKYSWDLGGKLKSITDSVSGIGLNYSYDSYDALKAEETTGAEKRETVRVLDNIGNVYETRNKTDREYGKGGQLKTARGCEYRYNDCGDLTEKIVVDGKKWLYTYHPNGLLEKVVRPDGNEVDFAYDPMGRRISKSFNGKTTKYLWDGDKIVHEWTEEIDGQPSEATAWLFDEDSFTPLAKLVGNQAYSIVSNHLGTPSSMFDKNGVSVWNAEVDIYGKLHVNKCNVVEREKCPFRFPGQYEDEETGLYYSRFRYYDPDMGMYTQRDPIGLEGGNPSLYGYVLDPNILVDPFGLKRKMQLAKNRANGKRAEDYVYNKLLNNKNVKVLGRQVYIKTPNVGKGRYVDILIQDIKTKKLIAVEVKSGKASRSVSQLLKDKIIAAGKGIFGKNAPLDMAGRELAGNLTTDVIVSTAKVPLWKIP
ncbi:MAG: RHS repeat-associated core domain-containing protein, partial [Clostridiales bacterium]|nr:RHS repeat-associated core domain-containing protein [Clostridiales bacterium]